jgi:hypothetical protein
MVKFIKQGKSRYGDEKIRTLRRGVFVDGILACDALWTLRWIPTFLKNMLSSSSGLSVNVGKWRDTQSDISQDNPDLHRREDLKNSQQWNIHNGRFRFFYN